MTAPTRTRWRTAAGTGAATNRPPGEMCAMTLYLRTGAGRYQAYLLEGGAVTATLR
jgi:hypothetical protein